MQRLVLALVLVVSVAPAFADGEGDEVPRSYESLNQREREHELQAQHWQGASGMWTSPHKAKGGAYRYRLMGIGGALLLGMGLVTHRLVKRANADRARNVGAPEARVVSRES